MSVEIRNNPTVKIDVDGLQGRLESHLTKIYGANVSEVCASILEIVNKYIPFATTEQKDIWSHQDMMLITYGDSILDQEQAPLSALNRFLDEYVTGAFNCVHILPFFPYSSDDGFSVIDYRQVNGQLGDWTHVNQLSENYKLMFDLVINHASRENLWFYDFVADRFPANKYFIEMDPDTNLDAVVRPRSSPLLATVNTHTGPRYLWATFSEDQIDLNFANPDVLLEFIEILFYYIANGARFIRLDAIAFLWKEPGTSCIHLPQTHEVVKLLRSLIDYVTPDCVLLTETNVPHEENLSYFGDGDEAHMVYQFTLPPLLLHAMNRGVSTHLSQWAESLPDLADNCTFFNFSASHDGVGLRALEGILPQHEIDDLVNCMHRFGGFVSMKKNSDGSESPYEINISYFDAMQGMRRGPDQWQTVRFICSQAIVMSMRGIPAIYIHSLLATPNDLPGVELTGRLRSINRKKWQYEELQQLLENSGTPNHEVYNSLIHLAKVRREEPCFHPAMAQQVLNMGTPFFVLMRYGDDVTRKLIAIHNITPLPQKFNLVDCKVVEEYWTDIITDTSYSIEQEILMGPYQFMWLLYKD